MNPNEFPTKGNYIRLKASLALARQGYDLMDKKRNILTKELMAMMDEAKALQGQISETFAQAYKALQDANLTMGMNNVSDIAHAIPIDDSIRIKTRSIMGTEIPLVEGSDDIEIAYSFYDHKESLDKARIAFNKAKILTRKLSEIENCTFRLADSIRKTTKRANALNNITIPRLSALEREMASALEEKEREEFTRLKVIKHRLQQ
jgi:V/A-type H+-transporting ATPase subunit D